MHHYIRFVLTFCLNISNCLFYYLNICQRKYQLAANAETVPVETARKKKVFELIPANAKLLQKLPHVE